MILVIFAMAVVLFAIRLGKAFSENRMMLSMNFCQNYEDVISGEEKQDLDIRGALRFNGCDVPYVMESNTYYISQDMNTDMWEGYFSSGKYAEIFFCLDEMWNHKLQAIESNHRFSLLVKIGDNYRIANIVISGIPVLALTETSDMYAPSDFVVLAADEEMSYSGYCNSHLRGQTSTTYPKCGYKVNLCDETGEKEKASLLGLRKDNDWILNPMYTDSSKVREKLAYQVWENMQEYNQTKDKSSNITYVEFIFDNMYWGIYGLMEPVDNKQLLMNETDIFYRKTDLVVPEQDDFYTEDGQEYIPGFRIKYPKLDDVKAEDWLPLQPYVKTFYFDIYDANIETEDDWETLSSLVDIENVADYEIFLNVISGPDNIFKNIDYIMRHEDDGYKMHMVPWDMDNSFGNIGAGAGMEQYGGGTSGIMTSREFVTLYRADRVYMESLLRDRWNEYRKSFLATEYLQMQVREDMDTLVKSGAMLRDSAKWPDANNFTDTSRLEAYIKDHMESLDMIFNSEEWWKTNNILKRAEQWNE